MNPNFEFDDFWNKARTATFAIGTSCLGCGSSFGSISGFCAVCWRFHLKPNLRDLNEVRQTPHGFPHHYVFRWKPGESDELSSLILLLKEMKLRLPFEFYARLMLRTILLNGDEIVVPAPASSAGRQHAQNLAREVAKQSGRPYLDTLVKLDSKTQKAQNRSDRNKVEFISRENLTHDGNVLFVDDVLTTGSTAMAAYKALGRPNGFTALTLAFRETLATDRVL